jgi:hypothetical protein
MFTGDVVSGKIPQAVLLPPTVLATTNQAVKVHLLNQQLLNFQTDDTLQRQEAVRADVPEEMSEEIRTRHAMYVPAQLIPYFLERRRTP